MQGHHLSLNLITTTRRCAIWKSGIFITWGLSHSNEMGCEGEEEEGEKPL